MLKHFAKALLQRPFTREEIAASIEKHLIKPPLPDEWYEVAQLARSRQGKGLADGWRETLIMNEIRYITDRPTWGTQRQALIELMLDHKMLSQSYKWCNKCKSEMAKEYLIHDMYNTEWPLRTRISLFAQQYIVSILSYVVLDEIGRNLYRFNQKTEVEFEFWDGILDRFQSLRWGMWDVVFLDKEKQQEMLDFMEVCITPILSRYGNIIDIVKDRIITSGLDLAQINRIRADIETVEEEIDQVKHGLQDTFKEV